MSAEVSFVLTDRQTDGQTALRSLRLRCIQCSEVCLYTDVTYDEVTKKKASKKNCQQCVLAAEILRWLQKIEKKSPSAPWAYFTNGPNAAASIAPTLIRHCRCRELYTIYTSQNQRKCTKRTKTWSLNMNVLQYLQPNAKAIASLSDGPLIIKSTSHAPTLTLTRKFVPVDDIINFDNRQYTHKFYACRSMLIRAASDINRVRYSSCKPITTGLMQTPWSGYSLASLTPLNVTRIIGDKRRDQSSCKTWLPRPSANLVSGRQFSLTDLISACGQRWALEHRWVSKRCA